MRGEVIEGGYILANIGVRVIVKEDDAISKSNVVASDFVLAFMCH